MTLPDRKYLYIASGVLLFAVLVYFTMFRSAAVTVESGSVTRGDMFTSIDAEGRSRYHDRFTITAPVSGKMFRILLHEGDRVPKGYVLTRIDPAPPRPTDPTRTPDTGVYPYAYNVYVPQDGILTRVFVTSEGIVQAGTPIAEVSRPSQIEAVADILSTDATQIRPHMPVRIENWGGGDALPAMVRNVEPQAYTKVSALGVEEQRVNVIIDFLERPERLGDNFRVDVQIILWEGKDVLRVPSSAVFRHGEGWAAYTISRSKARLREIQIGHRSPAFTQVTGGLAEGDSVILHPPNSVEDGTRVEAK
jgi:multidrug efflux pump subunit AcrA (membrane-fusion protein)